jgi:hypothetical protein
VSASACVMNEHGWVKSAAPAWLCADEVPVLGFELEQATQKSRAAMFVALASAVKNPRSNFMNSFPNGMTTLIREVTATSGFAGRSANIFPQDRNHDP